MVCVLDQIYPIPYCQKACMEKAFLLSLINTTVWGAAI